MCKCIWDVSLCVSNAKRIKHARRGGGCRLPFCQVLILHSPIRRCHRHTGLTDCCGEPWEGWGCLQPIDVQADWACWTQRNVSNDMKVFWWKSNNLRFWTVTFWTCSFTWNKQQYQLTFYFASCNFLFMLHV